MFLTAEEMVPSTVDLIYKSLQLGINTPAAQGFSMYCDMGGKMARHPDAARTCIGPEFRSAICQLAVSAPSLDPSLDAPIAQANARVLSPLYAALPGSYMNEMAWQAGLGTQPVQGWRERFWGSYYPKLAAVQKLHDPEGLMAVTTYSVGWEAPK